MTGGDGEGEERGCDVETMMMCQFGIEGGMNLITSHQHLTKSTHHKTKMKKNNNIGTKNSLTFILRSKMKVGSKVRGFARPSPVRG